jgi:hypothetical protein
MKFRYNEYNFGYPNDFVILTFHCTTNEKSIPLFTDVAIYEVAWYVIKQ